MMKKAIIEIATHLKPQRTMSAFSQTFFPTGEKTLLIQRKIDLESGKVILGKPFGPEEYKMLGQALEEANKSKSYSAYGN